MRNVWTVDRKVTEAWRHLETTRQVLKAADGLKLPQRDRKALKDMVTRAEARLKEAIMLLLAASDAKSG